MKLRTTKGKELVQKHGRRMQLGNAYQLLRELDTHYTVTVNGETFKAAYMEIIQEHVREWTDSYESFLSRWVDTWEKLADLDINYDQSSIKVSHFLNVLRGHPVFQVLISQNEVVLTHTRRKKTLSFDEWYQLASSAAMQADKANFLKISQT